MTTTIGIPTQETGAAHLGHPCAKRARPRRRLAFRGAVAALVATALLAIGGLASEDDLRSIPVVGPVAASVAGAEAAEAASWRCSWVTGCGYVFNRYETNILAGWYPGMFQANPHLAWLAGIGLGPISLGGLADGYMYTIKWTAIAAQRMGRCVAVRPAPPSFPAYIAGCP